MIQLHRLYKTMGSLEIKFVKGFIILNKPTAKDKKCLVAMKPHSEDGRDLQMKKKSENGIR